jgi:ubiquinone/menaquinone biosynthesis C-methylase UbiE
MVNKKMIPKSSRDRGKKRADDVTKMLDALGIKIDPGCNYLDIGAGDGVITKSIASALNTDSEHTYGVDIEHWSGKENNSDTFQFEYVNGDDFTTRYIDNTFDVVTVFQTLHHIKDQHAVLREMHRITQPGGVVILREHNAKTENDVALCHLEHLIYGILADGLDTCSFTKEYYGDYKSNEQWTAMMETYGFALLHREFYTNPSKYYYAIYTRTS